MDRNDYYGGESTSLNLIQVGNRLFVHVWTISLYKFIILLVFFFPHLFANEDKLIGFENLSNNDKFIKIQLNK